MRNGAMQGDWTEHVRRNSCRIRALFSLVIVEAAWWGGLHQNRGGVKGIGIRRGANTTRKNGRQR